MNATLKSKQDSLSKIEDTKTAILVSAEDPNTPYLLDLSNPMNIKSSILKKESHAERFNLFAEMLPDEEGAVISCKSLNMACLEAQLILKMFLSTFGPAAAQNVGVAP